MKNNVLKKLALTCLLLLGFALQIEGKEPPPVLPEEPKCAVYVEKKPPGDKSIRLDRDKTRPGVSFATGTYKVTVTHKDGSVEVTSISILRIEVISNNIIPAKRDEEMRESAWDEAVKKAKKELLYPECDHKGCKDTDKK